MSLWEWIVKLYFELIGQNAFLGRINTSVNTEGMNRCNMRKTTLKKWKAMVRLQVVKKLAESKEAK